MPDEFTSFLAQLVQAARLDWDVGPGYDGEPDLLVPSGKPCPCSGSGQFPDGLPCPIHDSRSLGAGNNAEDPKANGTFPVYGNSNRKNPFNGF